MPSIYDIKPAFQALLRPAVNYLAKTKITPNHVTIFACFCSFLVAGLIALFHQQRAIFYLFPIFLFLRMALNAIDGMLAKEHDMKTPMGALLNELTDMLADAALYLPFALLSPYFYLPLGIIIVLAVITEACGLAAVSIGASRRYDGPMGKSDRAFAFSLIAIALALGTPVGLWLECLWLIMIALLVMTVINRAKQALGEIQC